MEDLVQDINDRMKSQVGKKLSRSLEQVFIFSLYYLLVLYKSATRILSVHMLISSCSKGPQVFCIKTIFWCHKWNDYDIKVWLWCRKPMVVWNRLTGHVDRVIAPTFFNRAVLLLYYIVCRLNIVIWRAWNCIYVRKDSLRKVFTAKWWT